MNRIDGSGTGNKWKRLSYNRKLITIIVHMHMYRITKLTSMREHRSPTS
jgi:hypothetical protein